MCPTWRHKTHYTLYKDSDTAKPIALHLINKFELKCWFTRLLQICDRQGFLRLMIKEEIIFFIPKCGGTRNLRKQFTQSELLNTSKTVSAL